MKILNRIILSFLSFVILLSATSCTGNTKDNNEVSPEEAKRLAKEAYIFGLPALLWEKQFQRITYTTAPNGLMAPMGQFGHSRQFVDASNKMVVGFNVDCLYSFAGLDLEQEPYILSVPEIKDRYWIMQILNAWNDVVAGPGVRTYGEKGGNFMIAGPNWKGTIPDGVELIRSNTNITCIGGRLYSSGKEDYPMVNAIQDEIKLTPLSAWGSDYTPPTEVALTDIEFPMDVNESVQKMSAEEFFSNLNRLLVGNLTYEADKDVIHHFKKINIEAGQDFNLNEFSDDVQKAIKEGFQEGHEKLEEIIAHLGEIKNGWTLTYDMGRYGTEYELRAGWSYIGLGGNIIEDAFYPVTRVDENGDDLTGDNKYELTFAHDDLPPAYAFWSVTMYDKDQYLVDNELDRYALSDINDLKYNEDGSLTIYIQNERPSDDKMSNWLPAPKDDIRVTLRLYSPHEKVSDRTWIPPTIKKVN
ncbi:DUF1254 domain-containing protein [Flammeovirga yaeyamensis]|uniref:DUF1254 domain-containing protein n=1 Tax=Flammeovirga yaeyamensis TaxID=367791 RepID=A0AAX1N9P0_9BACT|nr:DUF1254 domain-containing protein [Flammeovirga yaeyamensis]MBB3699444.1 hypothetical protein [Flammeovirga yaeyamensis]NMF35299.1 DUF1254 domain-containing protein [Flammeovirga yaeyamensis]QWG04159.1 DUF1254 domain-containing protein [Flammeovirga yaeyamensis]